MNALKYSITIRIKGNDNVRHSAVDDAIAQSDIADYVLVYRGEKLAVIEAKKRDLPDTEGLGQAKKYAEKLLV